MSAELLGRYSASGITHGRLDDLDRRQVDPVADDLHGLRVIGLEVEVERRGPGPGRGARDVLEGLDECVVALRSSVRRPDLEGSGRGGAGDQGGRADKGGGTEVHRGSSIGGAPDARRHGSDAGRHVGELWAETSNPRGSTSSADPPTWRPGSATAVSRRLRRLRSPPHRPRPHSWTHRRHRSICRRVIVGYDAPPARHGFGVGRLPLARERALVRGCGIAR